VPRAFASCIVLTVILLPTLAHAQAELTPEEIAYTKRFHKHFTEITPIPSQADYTSVAAYDALFLGDKFEQVIAKPTNAEGGLAWGMSYGMRSLNEMFRLTRDPKYLEHNLRAMEAVLAARDDKTKTKLWNDKIAPAWSATEYSDRGRAIFAVHTGMIVYPMFECLYLVLHHVELREKYKDQIQPWAEEIAESLDYHNPQWRNAPRSQGYYVGKDQEKELEGEVLAGNRLSSMGRALWWSWMVRRDEDHRNKAMALGRYIRARLSLTPDDAYFWQYNLPDKPLHKRVRQEKVSGEDLAHASITLALPLLLLQEGVVFTQKDGERLANTVLHGFGRLHNGILFGNITGTPDSHPILVQTPARWFPIAKYRPEVAEVLDEFYRKYVPEPSPIEIALYLRYVSGKSLMGD
jgi:hypothetical protein